VTNRWIRRLLLALVTLAAVVASAWLPSDTRVGEQPPSLSPGSSRGDRAGGCAYDPANLPPPTGPEGRPANYLHTCGNRIYDAQGREVRIFGVNWSGMENGGYAPGGLGVRNWQEVLDQVAGLGYNTVRLPFSSEALEPGRQVGNVSFDLNPDLEGLTGLEMLDRLVAGARERGLKVILDRHQPTSGGRTTLWYSREVPEDRWIADWRMLAARYYGNDTVIAVDLHNEPHGPATWGSGDPATDWRLAAERAGNAVLEVNPYVLVFVEGIENYEGDHFWWGGNLRGVRTAPVRLRVPNRVVYSPHDYGPAVSGQFWFLDSRFPANLPEEWDLHWGYIHQQGIAPVVVGEFGGWSFGDDPDGQWQRALIAYLRARGIGALVWSLNPSWDTGGILAGDWQTVERAKQEAYRQMLAAPLDIGLGGAFGRAPTHLKVVVRQGEDGGQPSEVTLAFRIRNDGPTSIDLSRLELRYWFRAGERTMPEQRVGIESGKLAGGFVQADFVPTDRGGQDHYLRIQFAPGSGMLDRYRDSDKVTIRFQKPESVGHAQSGDYSFAGPSPPDGRLQEWDRVTLYLDGQLVWGREP